MHNVIQCERSYAANCICGWSCPCATSPGARIRAEQHHRDEGIGHVCSVSIAMERGPRSVDDALLEVSIELGRARSWLALLDDRAIDVKKAMGELRLCVERMSARVPSPRQ